MNEIVSLLMVPRSFEHAQVEESGVHRVAICMFVHLGREEASR